MKRVVALHLYFIFSFLVFGDERRIGWLANRSLSQYQDLGANNSPYEPSELYPDFSTVGALISLDGELGTATLVAPNMVVTAAHVLENFYLDQADPARWKFYHGADRSLSVSYEIESFKIHPSWKIRQENVKLFSNNQHIGDGDGDLLGVDIALALLKTSVPNIYPARLPNEDDDPIGQRAVLAGFGNLVNGQTGETNHANSLRIGGENIFDRSVEKVSVPFNWDPDGDGSFETPLDAHLGGILGIDFDGPTQLSNSLGQGESVELLGDGSSLSSPLLLEASTARGDSGGPAFSFTQNHWRIHGVVSYGTTNSTYGDVTIYTRLASHYTWLQDQLPNWADSKIVGSTDWRENPWLGMFAPVDQMWNFHINLGWLYIPSPKGNSFWAWAYLLGKWIWLSDQAYPYIYCYSPPASHWKYINLDVSNGFYLRAFSYSSGQWNSYLGSK